MSAPESASDGGVTHASDHDDRFIVRVGLDEGLGFRVWGLGFRVRVGFE